MDRIVETGINEVSLNIQLLRTRKYKHKSKLFTKYFIMIYKDI